MRKLFEEEREQLAQNGGTVVKCEEDQCGMDYYLFQDPKYTLEEIVKMFPRES